MATTALVVGAGAAAAGAAAQAGAFSGGKGGGGIDIPGRTLQQRIFGRETQRLLDSQRDIIGNALMQGSLVEPEVFRLLGFEPQFAPSPDVAPLIAERDRLENNLNGILEQEANLKGQRGGGVGAMKKRLRKDRKRLRKELEAANTELLQAQGQQNQLIGLSPREGGALDPTGDPNFSVAFQLQNETLVRALRGEEPVDSTLRTAFEEREQTLRERLRRQLGPDFETTTAGADALANFDREKSEAFEQFNRSVVGQFSQLTESRAAALSNLTGQRINQLFSPSSASFQRAQALGGVAQDRIALQDQQLREREFRLSGAVSDANAKLAAQQQADQRGAALGAGLSAIGSGLVGFGTTPGGGGDPSALIRRNAEAAAAGGFSPRSQSAIAALSDPSFRGAF